LRSRVQLSVPVSRPASENEKYVQWLADTYDLRQKIVFGTEVKSLIWDEDARLWDVQAVGPDGPRTWRVNAVMTAVGFLNRPQLPDLKGAEEFTGELFHTARWPAGLDITGKRVGRGRLSAAAATRRLPRSHRPPSTLSCSSGRRAGVRDQELPHPRFPRR